MQQPPSIATVASGRRRRCGALLFVENPLGAGRRVLVEWPARVRVLDDLGLRITALLDDEVAVVSLDDLFRLGISWPSMIANRRGFLRMASYSARVS
jgi:hypothetical protein